MLAARDFSNPLLWAVMIGWILSVVLHEFAHGLVAYLGGDYTIRERGGLTLNPLQYIDPVNSILLPIIFLLMGGVPLPGGVTYIRRDLLRNRGWESAVSLAGPMTNFLLFLALALPFHPTIGWIRPGLGNWSADSSTLNFLAALAMLQAISVIINLIPIPPLDGFGVISPFMDAQAREKLNSRQVALVGMVVLFFVVLGIPGVIQGMYNLIFRVMEWLGFDWGTIEFFKSAYNHALFGR